MYKILTSGKIDSVLLHDESDYIRYVKDKNFIEEDESKQILFGKPKTYPVILVTHFEASFNRFCYHGRFCNHKVYGEFIYPFNFDM